MKSLWSEMLTYHAGDGDDVFSPSAVQVVKPGVIGRLVRARQSFVHLAQRLGSIP